MSAHAQTLSHSIIISIYSIYLFQASHKTLSNSKTNTAVCVCVLIYSCRAAHEITQIKLKVNANNEAFRVNLCQFRPCEPGCLMTGHLEEVQRVQIHLQLPVAKAFSWLKCKTQFCGLFMQHYLAVNVTASLWHFKSIYLKIYATFNYFI